MSEIDDLNREVSRTDRDYFSYERDTNNKIAKRVLISNSSLPVTLEDGGISVNSYNEIISLAGLATSNVVLYTVPVGKILKLKRVNFSGDNRAVYKIDINGTTIAKGRTYYTDYNGYLGFEDFILVTGDVIKLIVENKTNMIADFNGNLQGSLIDA